ncbi:large ribosomal subunit protein mL64-like [Liolophura sinensis]|uniref:large ribosomal subunit protein mL64-like n=1 Tax=Liolophura sinensis TaxID=3198878 RepID=UPI003158AB9B
MFLACARQISTKNKVFLRRISPSLCRPRHLSSNERGEVVDEDVTDIYSLEEVDIDRIRNVSGLSEANRGRMAHARQMPEIKHAFQKTTKYQRKLYAKFGKESGIDAKISWPTLEQLKEIKEEEDEWEPSLQERWAKLKSAKEERQQRTKKREELIEKNMAEMDKWIKQYNKRLDAKKAEAHKQQAKKAKLLEEAREFFGYDVDPRDAKFQEMLEQKELQRKKEAKAKKKQDAAAKLVARIRMMAEESRTGIGQKDTSTESSTLENDLNENLKENKLNSTSISPKTATPEER